MQTDSKLCRPQTSGGRWSALKLSKLQKHLARLVHRFEVRGSAKGTPRPGVAGMNAHFGHLLHSDCGFFSRAAAIDCGETDRTLATARREGVIVRLRRGMYAPSDVYNSSDDAGKHLLHARAALAAQRGPVALTGPSAAALHGFAAPSGRSFRCPLGPA